MSPSETRAFRRATFLLLALSVLRWATAGRQAGPVAVLDSEAPELREASSDELNEAQRRARPLSRGERLDPNRTTAAELDRLPGVGEATAEAMVRDRERRGPFRSPEDLLRVPGIGPATLRRIEPYLDLSGTPLETRAPRGRGKGGRVDLNRASLEELQALPGIGPALAARIVSAREQRPFQRLDQLMEVSGIGPATLGRLRPHIRIGGIR